MSASMTEKEEQSWHEEFSFHCDCDNRWADIDRESCCPNCGVESWPDGTIRVNDEERS